MRLTCGHTCSCKYAQTRVLIYKPNTLTGSSCCTWVELFFGLLDPTWDVEMLALLVPGKSCDHHSAQLAVVYPDGLKHLFATCPLTIPLN